MDNRNIKDEDLKDQKAVRDSVRGSAISQALQNFFGVEIRNTEGIQPATLGSALDSYDQAPIETLMDWCGFKAIFLPDGITLRNPASAEIARKTIREDLAELIRREGAGKMLEELL